MSNDRFIYYLQADSAYFLRRFPEAVTAIESALKIQPNNALYLFLKGAYLMELGNYKEAAEAFVVSIRHAPLHQRSWTSLIAAYVAIGQPDEAARTKQEAVSVFGHEV
jgi:tetratricopeptide (TPR) repeat protein